MEETRHKIIFRFIKFIIIVGSLNVCTMVNFGESLDQQHVKLDQQLLIQTLMKLFFIHLLLVLISMVEFVTLLIIHMLEFVFYKK